MPPSKRPTTTTQIEKKKTSLSISTQNTATSELTGDMRETGFAILKNLLPPTSDGIPPEALADITAEHTVSKKRERVEGESFLEESCCVCLGLFEIGAIVRTLPCFHKFHTPCIDLWLSRHKTCPICMVDLFGGERY